MTWINWLGWTALLIAVGWAALAVMGSSRWRQATRALETQLEAARTAPAAKRYDMRELEGLPPPVERYSRSVLKDSQPIVAAARVDNVGTINKGETTDQWKPFTSRQHVVTRRPGFVWDRTRRWSHSRFLGWHGAASQMAQTVLREQGIEPGIQPQDIECGVDCCADEVEVARIGR